jgi:hypothetical protein
LGITEDAGIPKIGKEHLRKIISDNFFPSNPYLDTASTYTDIWLHPNESTTIITKPLCLGV